MAILRGLWNLFRRWVMHLFQANSLRAKRKRYVFGQVPTLPHLNVQNNATGDLTAGLPSPAVGDPLCWCEHSW